MENHWKILTIGGLHCEGGIQEMTQISTSTTNKLAQGRSLEEKMLFQKYSGHG